MQLFRVFYCTFLLVFSAVIKEWYSRNVKQKEQIISTRVTDWPLLNFEPLSYLFLRPSVTASPKMAPPKSLLLLGISVSFLPKFLLAHTPRALLHIWTMDTWAITCVHFKKYGLKDTNYTRVNFAEQRQMRSEILQPQHVWFLQI